MKPEREPSAEDPGVEGARPRGRSPRRRIAEASCGERYMHKEVWLIAQRQLEHAKASGLEPDPQRPS